MELEKAYRVLKVEKSATSEEIKNSYRELAKKYHPDLYQNNPLAYLAEEKLKEINEAYEVLENYFKNKENDSYKEESLELFPKKKKNSFEEIIKILEETYPNNVEVITMKTLYILPNDEKKENAIKQCLERLLEINPNDKNIIEYLERREVIPKEKNPDMVFVEGGSYIPSFYNRKKETFDLYVDKYMVTEEKYLEIMGKGHKSIRSNLPEEKDKKKPRNIAWIYALEYCNKLSKKYGLEPVYMIREEELVGISQLNGEKVAPNKADFEKTEGYRLPTEVEWEWFAFGGKQAQQKKSFDKRKFTATEIRAMAWDTKTNPLDRKEIGLKLPNELGLYDVFGNMVETVYDSCSNEVLTENNSYIFDSLSSKHVLRGGDCINSSFDIKTIDFPTLRQQTFRALSLYFGQDRDSIISNYKVGVSCVGTGIRVVRTANPKRK